MRQQFRGVCGSSFKGALTLVSLILRRRVSAVSKDEACAQVAATSHMRLPCRMRGEVVKIHLTHP